MTPEQKAVVLDAAQEMQGNDTWWDQFEYNAAYDMGWITCDATINPFTRHYDFRRKPRTITVTMPVPWRVAYGGTLSCITLHYNKPEDAATALAAMREAMGNNG